MTVRVCCACGAVLLWLLVCGWAAWQWRRNAVAQRLPLLAASTHAMPADAVLIVHASQTGQAVELAEMTAGVLRARGVVVHVAELAALDAAGLATWPRVLFVASTYGEGDPPDGAAAFAERVMAGLPNLRGVQYGVLALGDATYAHFCGFGRKLAEWLRACGASALFETVEVDRADGAALRRWQDGLARLVDRACAGHGDAGGSFAFDHRPWLLRERVHVNPGSSGAPCYHLALVPAAGDDLPVWQAGDIAEVLVPSNETRTGSFTLTHPTHAGLAVDDAGPCRLQETSGAPTVRRDYSIASLPEDGAIHLLLRQRHGADGALGLGSGWLTATAPLGATVSVRIRRHAAFHAPTDYIPMILIGNGTGIAGLRAHLKARAAAGRRRNWLLFGERNAASDGHYDAELRAWQAEGVLTRLDRVYSRDGAPRRYVQEALADAAGPLREWVAAGAAIYVCGSVNGMAGGVDAVLRQVLGDTTVTALTAGGRYRRDVY